MGVQFSAQCILFLSANIYTWNIRSSEIWKWKEISLPFISQILNYFFQLLPWVWHVWYGMMNWKVFNPFHSQQSWWWQFRMRVIDRRYAHHPLSHIYFTFWVSICNVRILLCYFVCVGRKAEWDEVSWLHFRARLNAKTSRPTTSFILYLRTNFWRG